MILKINSAKTFIKLPKFFINKFTVNFGCIPDEPSTKDYLFKDSALASAPIVETISLKRYFKEISDQGFLSSCVGNAVCDAFEAMQVKRLGVSPSNVENLSRLFVYWNARNLDTPPTTDRDRGSKIRFALDSARRYGIPYENIYPYLYNKVNKKPGWIPFKYAIQNKIKNFYRINANGDERIRQIIQALSSEHPVVFGTDVYEGFRNVVDDNVIKLNTSDKYLGGHAIVIVGWNSFKNAFEIRNSWGTGWGKKGYGFMDVNYIKSQASRDFWVATA